MTYNRNDSFKNFDRMNCVVLGSSGFIGTNLCNDLSTRVATLRGFSNSRQISTANDFEQIHGDFSDTEKLRDVLRGANIVYHLICNSTPASSNLDMVGDVQDNLIPTIRLLQICCEVGVSRVVFISSGGAVYGDATCIPTPESHQPRPRCAYAVNKLAVEEYLGLFELNHGLTAITLRVANPYGPYQLSRNNQGVIGTFLPRALRQESVEIWGDGSSIRDYIYVNDLVAALTHAAIYDGEERIFNIGSGTGTSLNEVVKLISEVVGTPLQVLYRSSRGVDVAKNILDCRLAKIAFGWDAETSLRDGIFQTFNWLSSKNRYLDQGAKR